MLLGGVAESTAQKNYASFPSHSTTDSRFLAIAGSGLSTLAGDTVVLQLATVGSADSIEIGIFDGETGGIWDTGTTPLEFKLFADPAGDGSGTHLVATWSGSGMPDNAWFTAKIKNVSQALSTTGNYVYRLAIRSTDASQSSLSCFKVRTDGTVAVKAHQSFNTIASMNGLNEARIVYPRNLTPTSYDSTTYDGTWTMYIDVPSEVSYLALWDGDMDYGSHDCTTRDTDDEDTPNDVKPAWTAGTSAGFEGVASGNPCSSGSGTSTGAPADDHSHPLFKRSPDIWYEIIDPNGVRYANLNPSGNLEWEQFKISTAPFNRATMDHHADRLPAGIYTLKVYGMDMSNLNAWRFSNEISGLTGNEIMGVDTAGLPVLPLRAVPIAAGQVEGYLYYDLNVNGQKESSEAGLAGATVSLQPTQNGTAVGPAVSAVSDAQGAYSFSGLSQGTYLVSVVSSSVGDGLPISYSTGAAAPYSVTLTQTAPTAVVNFGYRRADTHSVAGVMFADMNANGVRDSGEPPIAGVLVYLDVDANSDGVYESTLSMLTATDGSYRFSGLYTGVYRIRLDSQTFTDNLEAVGDPDGISTPGVAVVTVRSGVSVNGANFAYRRLNVRQVSGLVYYDANSNGAQDAGEPGIPSVTVTLDADIDNDGQVDARYSTTTDINGGYRFSSLYSGTYVASLDIATLAEDVAPTADADGITTPHTATIYVRHGQSDPAAPFGYIRTNPPGTRTRGYWVNHPNAWPVSTIVLGGVTYSKAEAIGILQRATKGDVTYSMAAQLIATKLNLLCGATGSCITSTVSSADSWLQQNPIGSQVKASSSAWTNPGNSLHNTLDSYNNGRMCASHMN